MSEDVSSGRDAADLAYEFDLTLPQARHVTELLLHRVIPVLAPDAPAHLADAEVARALVELALGPFVDGGSVDRLAEVIEHAIDRGYDNAGVRYVQACIAEERGDAAEQRRLLELVLARDAGFGRASADLGFLAFVEGDVAQASRHLAAADDDPTLGSMVHTLTHYPTRRPEVGRNEPCTCGSGRKQKHCCVDPPRHPLEHRAYWLWDKAAVWLRRLPQHGALFGVACGLAGVDDPDDDEAAVTAALQHELTETVALLEAGLLRRFLDRLGHLLPSDERALAEQWLDVRNRVWHVEDTRPGYSLVLTEVGGGRTVVAGNGRVSRCTEPGEVVFGAVLPTGTGWYLPHHPACLAPPDGDAVAALVRADIDPVTVSATVFRGNHGATM